VAEGGFDEAGGGESADEVGDELMLDLADRCAPMEFVATALEEDVLDKAVAVPLTSLSISSVGSRLTNSFCSNWTTTYGLACTEVTLRPRADMSLTWIWPLDDTGGPED